MKPSETGTRYGGPAIRLTLSHHERRDQLKLSGIGPRPRSEEIASTGAATTIQPCTVTLLVEPLTFR